MYHWKPYYTIGLLVLTVKLYSHRVLSNQLHLVVGVCIRFCEETRISAIYYHTNNGQKCMHVAYTSQTSSIKVVSAYIHISLVFNK